MNVYDYEFSMLFLIEENYANQVELSDSDLFYEKLHSYIKIRNFIFPYMMSAINNIYL